MRLIWYQPDVFSLNFGISSFQLYFLFVQAAIRPLPVNNLRLCLVFRQKIARFHLEVLKFGKQGGSASNTRLLVNSTQWKSSTIILYFSWLFAFQLGVFLKFECQLTICHFYCVSSTVCLFLNASEGKLNVIACDQEDLRTNSSSWTLPIAQ